MGNSQSAVKDEIVWHWEPSDSALTLRLPACLDAHYVGMVWQSSLDELQARSPKHLLVEGGDVRYCDGSGAQWLIALEAFQHRAQSICHINHLSSGIQALLDHVKALPRAKAKASEPKRGCLVGLGWQLTSWRQIAVQWIMFLGRVCSRLWRCCCASQSFSWRDAWPVFEAVGPGSWFVVSLMGILFGLIMGFQGSVALSKFGAQSYVPNLVTISMLRELAPLMAAVVLIGRSGSAFAAELGGMKINQEVDALDVMAVDFVDYLVLPRVLASVLLLPCMAMLMVFFGLVGCAFVVHLEGYSLLYYFTKLQDAFSLHDMGVGIIKTFFYGFSVAVIGCRFGLLADAGPRAVGRVTTAAVVASIIAVTVIDGLFGVIYYSLGW